MGASISRKAYRPRLRVEKNRLALTSTWSSIMLSTYWRMGIFRGFFPERASASLATRPKSPSSRRSFCPSSVTEPSAACFDCSAAAACPSSSDRARLLACSSAASRRSWGRGGASPSQGAWKASRSFWARSSSFWASSRASWARPRLAAASSASWSSRPASPPSWRRRPCSRRFVSPKRQGRPGPRRLPPPGPGAPAPRPGPPGRRASPGPWPPEPPGSPRWALRAESFSWAAASRSASRLAAAASWAASSRCRAISSREPPISPQAFSCWAAASRAWASSPSLAWASAPA